MSMNKLAANLRRLRLAKKLTQVELAEASGVQQRTISNLETGETIEPGVRTAAALARALGVTVERLLK